MYVRSFFQTKILDKCMYVESGANHGMFIRKPNSEWSAHCQNQKPHLPCAGLPRTENGCFGSRQGFKVFCFLLQIVTLLIRENLAAFRQVFYDYESLKYLHM
jgi:hypothetical protein